MRRKTKLKIDARIAAAVNVPEEKREPVPKGHIYIPGIGNVKLTRWFAKSYYYAVPIPQDVDADMTIGLFEGHIGEKEWTNFTRSFMLPEGHNATIYKVTLSVLPTEQARIVDVFTALQFGDITISTGTTRDTMQEFTSEPLSFFPVTLYGEIAGRENDLLERLAICTEITDTISARAAEDGSGALSLLSGLSIPVNVGDTDIIDGRIDLRKGLYGSPKFTLYVILHSLTSVMLD